MLLSRMHRFMIATCRVLVPSWSPVDAPRPASFSRCLSLSPPVYLPPSVSPLPPASSRGGGRTGGRAGVRPRASARDSTCVNSRVRTHTVRVYKYGHDSARRISNNRGVKHHEWKNSVSRRG